jgi:hypothetical protein
VERFENRRLKKQYLPNFLVIICGCVVAQSAARGSAAARH